MLPVSSPTSDAIPGVSALVIHEDRVLLVKRGRGPALGQWALPGGRVEAGELPEDAVVREVAEETGIAVDDLRALETIAVDAQHDGHSLRYAIIVFAAGYRSGAPVAGDDAAEARWVAFDALADLPLTEGTRAVIARHGSPAHA